MHCVDRGESLQTRIYLQHLASIQPRTSPLKFADFECAARPVIQCKEPRCTGSALIITGALMMRQVSDVNWKNEQEAIPAFMTIVLMPFGYSIFLGLFGGIVTWLIMAIPDLVVDSDRDNFQGNFEGKGAILPCRNRKNSFLVGGKWIPPRVAEQ